MYKLFYYPRNASWVPHMLLEEVKADYELILVDRKSEAQKSSEYLKLNPTGRIPTLVDGDQTILESAAISLHICEQHSESNLIPTVGDVNRTEFFQWLFYLTSTVQSELMLFFYPDKHTLDTASSESIAQAQEQRVTEMFVLIDKSLQGKEYLVGDNVTVCDFFLFMLSHWASGFKTPPLSFDHLGCYLKTFAQRPAVKHVCKVEGTSLAAYQS